MGKKISLANAEVDFIRRISGDLQSSIVYSEAVYDSKNSSYDQDVTFSVPVSMLNSIELMANNNLTTFQYHNIDVPIPSKPDNDKIENEASGFFEIKNIFNYYSEPYERISKNQVERKMPNFYLEFTNEKNKKYSNLKALQARKINKNFFKNIRKFQDNLAPRPSQDLDKISNVIIGDYNDTRDFSNLSGLPYYARIAFSFVNDVVLGDYLTEIEFNQQFFNYTLNKSTSEVIFETVSVIDEQVVVKSTEVPVSDLFSEISKNNFLIDDNQFVVLQNEQINKSIMVNGFKNKLLTNYIKNKSVGLVKPYKEIFSKDKCRIEHVFYKVEKFIGPESSVPEQTYIVSSGRQLVEIIDTQIKLDQTYTYKIKTVSVIYGTEYTINDYSIDRDRQTMTCNITSRPSYKIVELDVTSQETEIKPRPQLSPSVRFFNKNDSSNEIGIYLDLRVGQEVKKPVTIQSTDPVYPNNEKVKFEYLPQQGKFEVFRIEKKPESYGSFTNEKIMDIQNSINSTSVSFRDTILSNKKYYYIFRTLSTSGEPSPPTPIYEVELLKDSDDSKVLVSTYDFEKQENYLDKRFKRLIQIEPAFQQSVFDDRKNNVNNLTTFKGHLDTLSLGYANEGIWGRKFKIRIKSRDSGKIVDFNIKFNLAKKKTKEDLE